VKAVFLLALLALAWTYFGYPLAMFLLARRRPRAIARRDWEPMVDIVIVAYNAADELRTKLANLAALDYPADRLCIYVASDGSEDLTAQVLNNCEDPRLRASVFPLRRGKSACLADLIPQLRGEIAMFADTRQRIERDALRALLRPLADPEVGVVGGELMFERASSEYGSGLDFYWRYEKFLRSNESQSGSMIGVSGALCAARTALLPKIPPGLVLDDLWIPLEIARAGKRIVLASDARAWDRPSADPVIESARKRRTLAGNFQLIARDPSLLLPWAHPLGWRLWGHKWLRLAAPWCMFALLLSNLDIVLAEPSRLWLLFALAQCAFYTLAVAGILKPDLLRQLPVRIAATFVRMNMYAVLGLFDFLAGRAGGVWYVTRHKETLSR
jgi:cellulose synthase/poly-beta-1,6-N-acetylglucosamine synthase-like glycosyltransferase